MKKHLFKFTASLLTVAFLLVPITSSAEEIINGDSGGDRNYIISEKEQIIEAIKESHSKQEINELKTKLAIINGQMNRASYSAATISVPYYKQQTGYYCGPATTKQTLQFMNGSSGTQDSIATALGTTTDGTDGTRIVKYLNEKMKGFTWTIATDLTNNGLKTRIYNSITGTTKRPPIMRSKFNKGGNWSYSTAGHYMNISGFTKDLAKVRITDPNIGRVISNHSGSYYVTFSETKNAILDHWAQHIYW